MDVTLSVSDSLKAELSQYKNVIIANGDFPKNEFALTLIRNAQHVVCCDGAVENLVAMGFSPTAVVGDCDSQRPESLRKWQSILHVDKSQEYNDLQKALDFCILQKYSSVALFGCSGLRDDHFIANVSIMVDYSLQLPLVMVTDFGIFNVIHDTTVFQSFKGEQVSIFAQNVNIRFTFHGLKYPVENRAFVHLWEGSLNESLGDTFCIELHNDGTAVVFRNF